MPSRDGLLNHLHIEHLERVRIVERMANNPNGFFETLPFSGLAKLHGEFHRLDTQDRAVISSKGEADTGSAER